MRPLVFTTPLLTLMTLALASGTASAQSQPPPAAPPPPASAPDVAPPEYPPPSARWGVVAAGLGTTAVAYGAALGASYIYPDVPGTNDLRIPIAGPWLAIAHNGCPADEPDCSKTIVVLRSIVSALDGIAQAGGLAIALEGLFMPTEIRSYAPPPATPRAAPPPPSAPPSPSQGEKNLFFLPTPMNMGERGIGVGVVGRF